ncbi:MAG: AAA family ATPase [Lachnospiraceae bacterium]|nr:AAA family ATPase [Lachnospiraceae bacterium]
MKLSRVIIKNYRNIRDADACLDGSTALIGENNSGKSNFLRAITLPLYSEENSVSKNLTWEDINATSKEIYYKFLQDNRKAIVNGEIGENALWGSVPVVSVELCIVPETVELYYTKDIITGISEEKFSYGLRYEFKVKKPADLLTTVKSILADEEIEIENARRSLLPIEFYSYSIIVPNKNSSVSYDTLRQFRYVFLPAERDSFAAENHKIGSKSLVNLLEMKFSQADLLQVEKEYEGFFNTLKHLGGMESVLNWQESSDIPNASDFVKNISVMPNMPSISSILNSVRLGFNGETLSLQGLGQRNIILLLVLLNSYRIPKEDIAINVVIVEEPEAHLCINNVRLMCSFIRALTSDNKKVQMFYSTHSTEFINKHDLKDVVVLDDGKAYSLGVELDEEARNYLAKNPNTHIFKLLFSHRCILVEGISEELLIKGYIQSKAAMSDIDVLSFHKGYTTIMDIWLKLNSESKKKLGVVRDFDDQTGPKAIHEKYNQYDNICVKTTSEYTLEPEIVQTGNNYDLLKTKYGAAQGWSDLSAEALSDDWRKHKAGFMMQLSYDLANGELDKFEMPLHIKSILDFMEN